VRSLKLGEASDIFVQDPSFVRNGCLRFQYAVGTRNEPSIQKSLRCVRIRGFGSRSGHLPCSIYAGLIHNVRSRNVRLPERENARGPEVGPVNRADMFAFTGDTKM
jgi:hypothetical protein